MSIHLITGRAGEKHVSAADEGALNAAVFGSGQYVLNEGGKMAATVVSNNSVRIADGAAMFNGRYIRLDRYEDLTIESGTQGTYRNDLIVIRYTKDTTGNTESAKLAVIKGTASGSTAADPAHVSGNILEGAVQAEMPLYRIPLDNVNIGTPVALFKMMETNVGNLDGKQEDTKNLAATTALADGDYFPFYDVSASGNRKTLWSNMLAKIKTAIWGTTSGFVKADGSGGISGVSTISVANGGTGATTAAAARTNLGLGSVATLSTVPISNGGTGATTAAAARTNLGLGSVATLDSNGKVTASQASSSRLDVTASKTLAAGDAGRFLLVNSGSSVTITIPNDSSGTIFPTGTEIEVCRLISGSVTIEVGDSTDLRGATLNNSGGRGYAATINTRYGVACLKKVTAETWIIAGDVS